MKGGTRFAYGDRIPLRADVAPGSSTSLDLPIKPAVPPGQYTLLITAMQEGNWWFAEAGKPGLSATVTVQ